MTTKQPTTAQHWLDCMPVLPLERGVPVLDFGINPSWVEQASSALQERKAQRSKSRTR